MTPTSQINLPQLDLSSYDIGRILGHGGFATVHLAKHRTTKKRYAIKLVDLTHPTGDNPLTMGQMLEREINVHSSVSDGHENILTLFGFFQTKNVIGVVMEHCKCGDLQSLIKARKEQNNLLTEGEARVVLRQVLRGLEFLHSRGIAHRDIKGSNILLDGTIANAINTGIVLTEGECVVKICDFGLAVQMSHEEDWDSAQYTICGTPNCLAPEVALSFKRENEDGLEGSRGDCGHGRPADLWGCGCIFYAMLFGMYPFSCRKIVDTIQRVIKGSFNIPEGMKRISREGMGLIQQLLTVEPDKRGSAENILMAHPFFCQQPKLRSISEPLLNISEQQPPCGRQWNNSKCNSKDISSNQEELKGCNEPLNSDTCVHTQYISNKQISKASDTISAPEKVPLQKVQNNLPNELLQSPICDVHRLKPFKQTCKKSTFYILSHYGIVVHSKNIWMHISADGLCFYVGKLGPPSEEVEHNGNLITEAFARAPSAITLNCHYDPSTNYLPISYNPQKIIYAPLSSLHRKYHSILSKVQILVENAKGSTPKVTLHLHNPDKSLMGKAILMENGPLPDIHTHLVNGIQIYHCMRDGSAKLLDQNHNPHKELLLDFTIDCDTNNMCIGTVYRDIQRYEPILLLAQSTTEQCLLVEQEFETLLYRSSIADTISGGCALKDEFPVEKRIIVNRNDKNQWVSFLEEEKEQQMLDLNDYLNSSDGSVISLESLEGR